MIETPEEKNDQNLQNIKKKKKIKYKEILYIKKSITCKFY